MSHLVVQVVLAETLVCVKFSHGLFPQPWPAMTIWAWGLGSAALAAFFGAWSLQHYVLGKGRPPKAMEQGSG